MIASIGDDTLYSLSLSLNHYNKDYLLTTPSVNNIMQFACFNSILSWKYKHCWILRDGVGCLDERRDKFIYFGSSINNPMSAFSKWLDPNVYYFARILLCPKIRAFFSISLVAREIAISIQYRLPREWWHWF